MPRLSDASRLTRAENHFRHAQELLQGINLRTYRGRLAERDAIQEARNSADCGIDWSQEARRLASEPDQEDVIDVTVGRLAKVS